MEAENHNLVALLDQTFEKGAWHGPSVKEALANVSEVQAQQRLSGTHSIIELVAHMTAWRTYVLRKLNGDAEYKLSDEMNFPAADNWVDTLQKLGESQKQLLDALQNLPAEKLAQQVPGSRNPLTFYTLLHAIIHHDLYHTGQIVLIKKVSLKQTF